MLPLTVAASVANDSEHPANWAAMASQAVSGSEDLASFEFQSFVRGYHVYKSIWDPMNGEVLRLAREPDNCQDKLAVAVMKEDSVVGHIPHHLAPIVSAFLKRNVNKGMAEVIGERVNRDAGYGLEVPCTYRFYGSKPYIDRLRRLVDSIREEGRL